MNMSRRGVVVAHGQRAKAEVRFLAPAPKGE